MAVEPDQREAENSEAVPERLRSEVEGVLFPDRRVVAGIEHARAIRDLKDHVTTGPYERTHGGREGGDVVCVLEDVAGDDYVGRRVLSSQVRHPLRTKSVLDGLHPRPGFGGPRNGGGGGPPPTPPPPPLPAA